MSNFISHLNQDLRRARLTRRGASDERSDDRGSRTKKYPRMERIALPQPAILSTPLGEALIKRISASAGPTVPLALDDLGSLFGNALKQRAGSFHRNYPSGGARFPTETYLLSSEIGATKPGSFHYRPDTHELERLWDLPSEMGVDELIIHDKPENLEFSSLLIFTAAWERSSAKYGDFAYILSLLETGHMSQNVLLAAAALGIAARPMGGFDDEKIARLLDLDEEREQTVHAITLAKSAADEQSGESSSEFYG